MKIQIDIQDDTDYAIALNCVKQVIQQGRISEGRHRKIYCRATVFSGIGKYKGKEIVVLTNDTTKVDSFVVYTKSKQ